MADESRPEQERIPFASPAGPEPAPPPPVAAGPAPAAPPAPAPPDTRVAFEQEVRLAVVLYGGVSLAIYINGVAQELLRLVRATAPAAPGSPVPHVPDDRLDSVERAYRDLGCWLGSSTGESPDPASGDRAIRTRFVVDVISGTSAGGINGVFLGCALARHQSMEQLKSLWVHEGEMDRLLNDAGSVADLDGRLSPSPPTRSLLNSRRMYLKLLDALQGMESNGGLRDLGQSALVDELDLFVTATDLRGLVLKLKLADMIVYERRFRSVFHFVHATEYGTGSVRNDFRLGNNPFLAFAARCTSSFPGAFEPMTLDQATELLGALRTDPEVRDAMKSWPKFYREYRSPAEIRGREQDPDPGPFSGRPFGDGGYLDNKPFGHAIAALRNRRDDLPIQRKLFYVEPSPDHPELDLPVAKAREVPDAFENLMLAATVLPRQETIREDLSRLLERNRRIEYIRRATRSVSADFHLPRTDAGLHESKGEWGRKWLRDVVQREPAEGLPRLGGAYGAYHRLRVSEVTTEMAQVVARVAGLPADSDEAVAVRFLLSAWRQERYREDRDPDHPQAEPENAFLMRFDLSYRLRRIRFIQDRIQMFLADDRHADSVLSVTWEEGEARERGSSDDRRGPWSRLTAGQKRAVAEPLRGMLVELARIQVALRATGRSLRRTPPPRDGANAGAARDPLHELIEKSRIGWDQIKLVLRARDAKSRIETARRILREVPPGEPSAAGRTRLDRVDEFAQVVASRLTEAFREASREVRAVLHPSEADVASRELLPQLRHCLWHHYRRFDYFDMVLFPMAAGADVGEMHPVDVLRISPEDATRLYAERDPNTHHRVRGKLAGTRLGNFGAFLDATWRRSDILWGRLDAAERIVRGVAPAPPAPPGAPPSTPDRILARLHGAIVGQELNALAEEEAREVFVEAFLHEQSGSPDLTVLNRALELLLPEIPDPAVRAVLQVEKVRATYHRRFRDHRGLDREKQIRLLARGTQVFGRMLDGLADRYAIIQKRVVWLMITSGRILNGLVEIAIPRSVWELFGVYWLNLLYALETIIVIAGQFLPDAREVRDVGLALLGVTFAADIARQLLRLFLQLRARWVVLWILLIPIAAVLVLGALKAQELVGQALTAPDSLDQSVGILLAVAGFLGFAALSRGVVNWAVRRKAAERAKLDSTPVARPGQRA